MFVMYILLLGLIKSLIGTAKSKKRHHVSVMTGLITHVANIMTITSDKFSKTSSLFHKQQRIVRRLHKVDYG